MSEQEQVKPIPELENPQIRGLFPTPLFSGKLSDLSLCDSIEKELYRLRTAGHGSWEAENWVSEDRLHEMDAFMPLSQLVLQETGAVLNFLHTKCDGHYITNMWANITNPNHRHPVHLHPNALLSGVLYIKTPKNCGPIGFIDPRPAARVFEPNYETYNEWNSGRVMMQPEKGVMYIWPSWLTHGVDRGFTEEKDADRIVVAFNIMMVGEITTKTACLKLS